MPTLTLDRLAFGGDAVGRLDGKAVFVPLGAPGDVAEVAIEVDHARFARARLLGVTAPGPARTAPTCPHFAVCGGCQWQHLEVAAQQEAKRAIVAEHLARIAGLGACDVAPVVAGPAWAYRDRITLACDAEAVGLRALRSHRIVPIETCPVASDPVRAHLAPAAAFARALGPGIRSVTVVAAQTGAVLVVTGGRPSGTIARAARRRVAPDLRGVIWRGSGRRVAIGDTAVRRTLDTDLELVVPADVFTQVSAWAHPTLVAHVLRLAGDAAGRQVLDLYCGAGTLGLPLARRGARVYGIERDRAAVAAARANATRLGLADVVIAAGDVRRAITGAPPADLVVLDPPRRGAADVIDPLLARRPPRLVYVSCDPATFARDAGRLVAGGYTLGPVQPFDIFPQTFHVEIAAALWLT